MHSARMLGSGDQRWVIGKAEVATQPEERDRSTHRAKIIACSTWGGGLKVIGCIDVRECGTKWIKA